MRLALSIGDIHGIGPEIILKTALESQSGKDLCVVIGSLYALEYYRDQLGLPVRLSRIDTPEKIENLQAETGRIHVLSVAEPESIRPGTVSANAGNIAMQSLEAAAALCRDGFCDALVTAPLHKEAIALAGYRNTGHTDFLADFFGVTSQIMLFVDPLSNLRVALATIHEPLSKVPELVRTMNLEAFFTSISGSLLRDFRINEPKIAVLGLNPHASDGGVMGTEEASVIRPVIERLAGSIYIEGPFPADGFFGAKRYRNYDLVVAMYHDQGLLPFKVLAFDTGINVTLGLPIVRTSPDHGTGFDQAGKGTASARSLHEAVILAGTIARNRKKPDTIV